MYMIHIPYTCYSHKRCAWGKQIFLINPVSRLKVHRREIFLSGFLTGSNFVEGQGLLSLTFDRNSKIDEVIQSFSSSPVVWDYNRWGVFFKLGLKQWWILVSDGPNEKHAKGLIFTVTFKFFIDVQNICRCPIFSGAVGRFLGAPAEMSEDCLWRRLKPRRSFWGVNWDVWRSVSSADWVNGRPLLGVKRAIFSSRCPRQRKNLSQRRLRRRKNFWGVNWDVGRLLEVSTGTSEDFLGRKLRRRKKSNNSNNTG